MIENNWDQRSGMGTSMLIHSKILNPHISLNSVTAGVSSIWIKVGTFPIALLEDDAQLASEVDICLLQTILPSPLSDHQTSNEGQVTA